MYDFDVILGNGDIITNVSKNKHSDLYYGIGGTYGTLAIITRVKMKLINCDTYVKIKYFHHNSFKSFYLDFTTKIKSRIMILLRYSLIVKTILQLYVQTLSKM